MYSRFMMREILFDSFPQSNIMHHLIFLSIGLDIEVLEEGDGSRSSLLTGIWVDWVVVVELMTMVMAIVDALMHMKWMIGTIVLLLWGQNIPPFLHAYGPTSQTGFDETSFQYFFVTSLKRSATLCYSGSQQHEVNDTALTVSSLTEPQNLIKKSKMDVFCMSCWIC